MIPDQKRIVDNWLHDRHKARTDLFFLAKEVLRYDWLDWAVHGEIVDHLQKFTGGTDTVEPSTFRALPNGGFSIKVDYKPASSVWELDGPRKRLILFPRGHLKTTIITISHSLQWIINYSDIRILISTAIGDQATKIMTELKAHLQYNNHFRFLFPEYCPADAAAAKFGSTEAFVIPNRRRKWLKEPTVSVSSVGKVIAGGHYEVLKHSDIVDKENIRTPQQVTQVIDHWRYSSPLIERGPIVPGRDTTQGWEDIEGTIYDFSDLYCHVIDSEEKLKPAERTWSIYKRAAINPDGTALWPTRFPLAELNAERQKMGDSLFSSQYLLNPLGSADGLCTPEKLEKLFIKQSVIEDLLPRLRLHATVDLHGMEAGNDGNDFTCISVCGWDRDGRMYVIEGHHGRFTPIEVINAIFNIYLKYQRRIVDFKIEKDAHARVLLAWLEREKAKRQLFPMIVALQRDSRQSKQDRIRGLQPFFDNGAIRFSELLTYRLQLKHEVTKFPKYSHDDILDTLADQLRNKDGGVEYNIYPDPPKGEFIPTAIITPQRTFMGFDAHSHKPVWSGEGTGADESQAYDDKTGL